MRLPPARVRARLPAGRRPVRAAGVGLHGDDRQRRGVHAGRRAPRVRSRVVCCARSPAQAQAECGEADPHDCFSVDHFLEEILIKSDTSMAIASSLPIRPEHSAESILVRDKARRISARSVTARRSTSALRRATTPTLSRSSCTTRASTSVAPRARTPRGPRSAGSTGSSRRCCRRGSGRTRTSQVRLSSASGHRTYGPTTPAEARA